MKKLTVTLSVILTVCFLAACTEDESTVEQLEQRVVTVETAIVTEDDFVSERSVYGRTTPNAVTPVLLPLAGGVTELDVTNGDTVNEGDRIAVLTTAQGTVNIDAPSGGQVASLTTAEGAAVSGEEPLAMITDTDKMTLQFSVTPNVLELFTLDETYTARIDDEQMDATITLIDTMPGETGLYPVEATVENPNGSLLTGMVIEMIVPEVVREAALIVPTEAVVTENNESFVYVITDNKANKLTVTVQEVGSEHTAIDGDIAAGDEIVTSGQLTLADGDEVEVDAGKGE